MIATPSATRSWSIASLRAEHGRPPRHPHKAALYAKMEAASRPEEGVITMARWEPAELPVARSVGRTRLEVREGFFDYRPSQPDAVAWWVNFADPNVFGFADTGLLAQDELQCVEIPALPWAREAWMSAGLPALTVERGQPTPITVWGAPRLAHLETGPMPTRPWGLYGNAFACAPVAPVLAALTLTEPTPAPILAMAAPRGRGPYTARTMRHILHTATTSFAAAMAATGAAGLDPSRVEVHTGWWGCGAFGGDRELMALLQLEAADLAGLGTLVFHGGEPGGQAPLASARDVRSRLRNHPEVDGLVQALVRRDYRWGVSNST